MSVSLKINIEKVKSIRYGNNLLDKVQVHLDEPGILWVYGSNGSGKSTFTSILSGKASISGGLDIQGNVNLSGIEHLSYLPQRVGASFLALQYQDDICLSLEGRFQELTGNTKEEKNNTAIGLMEQLSKELDISKYLLRESGQNSYGETRRMEFGIASVSHANLVILDEPFSGLDLHWRQELARIITKIANSYPSIWVITAHEPPEDLGLEIFPKITLALQSANQSRNIFTTISNYVIEYFRKNNINPKEQESIKVTDLVIERKKPNKTVIQLPLLKAEANHITWIQGENGSGKSTVCNVLAGLQQNSNNFIVMGLINGKKPQETVRVAPNSIVRLAMQDPYKSFIHPTMREELFADEAKDISLISQLELMWGSFNRKPSAFSFGQLRFLQLLLFPVSTKIIIFDEPLLGLAPELHELFLQTLRAIASTGRTIICTSHLDVNLFENDEHFSLKSSL